MGNDQNRRKFLETAAATTAVFTIVPRHVLGGPGVVAPSDKITLGHIGVGTEGLREIQPLLAAPEIQIISVYDPNQHAAGYRDWSKTGIRDGIRRMLGDSNWTAGGEDVIPGGRDVAKDIIDTYYSKQRSGEKLRGCSTYADFREMLDKERDLNAVKIKTPDHLHGVIAIAAMKRGKHVIVHKPIANRMMEARRVIATARGKGVSTHFMPWGSKGSIEQVMGGLTHGPIGTLRKVTHRAGRA